MLNTFIVDYYFIVVMLTSMSQSKSCCKCKTNKDGIKFIKVSEVNSKCYYRCQSCQTKKNRAYWKKNRKTLLPINRQKHKRWYETNRASKLASNKAWYKANKEKAQNYHREYERKKRKNPIYRLHQSISSALRRGLKGSKNKQKWQTILGYSTEQLKQHLESLFTKGMTWKNYGKWHIDHKRPIASFDISSQHCDDFKTCWALSNLQPLWAKDNLSKGDSIS